MSSRIAEGFSRHPGYPETLFAKRATAVTPSGIRKMFELASSSAINLGLGEPDLEPPELIREALVKAVREGRNRYGHTAGLAELRTAIAERLSEHAPVRAEDVLITVGATEALAVTMQTLIDGGDEVLTPDPGFVLFAPHIALAGGTPVYYTLRQENGFLPDVEELRRLVTPRTKAIIVNTPSNPTGAVFDRRTVEGIAELARDEGLVIVSDEVYDAMVYDGRHETFLGSTDRVVYVNSFSKVYAMTGWRLGYVTAPSDVIQHMAKIHYYMVACPPTPTQYAVLAGIRGPQDAVHRMVEEFRARRDLIVSELNRIPNFECGVPGGAFYAFPSFSFPMGSVDLAMKILEAGVICSPGSAFGKAGEGHLRFSYANSQENIRKAMEIIRGVTEAMPPGPDREP